MKPDLRQEALLASMRARVSRGERRAIERAAKEKWERVIRPRLQATSSSGAGLLMDRELRHWFKEFNSRLTEHGPDSMPSSFNVLNAFFAYNKPLGILDLLPEKDHAFAFSDFIDFVTGEENTFDPYLAGRQFPERTIHSYTAIDDPHHFQFSAEGGRRFGIAGVSLARHGAEISVLMIAATPVLPEDDNTETIKSVLDAAPFAGREWISEPQDGRHESRMLDGHLDLRRVLALTRIDLGARTMQVRDLLIDQGPAYTVASDDPAIFGEDFKSFQPEAFHSADTTLREHAVLFELAKTCVLLPSYFGFKFHLVRHRVERTKHARPHDEPLPNTEPTRTDAAPAIAERVRFRRVAALEIISTDRDAGVHTFTPPMFQVEVRGYWRTLALGQIGKDPEGRPVEGRTWVTAHVRWRDRPSPPIQVLVKARVAAARETVKAEEHREP